MAPRPVEAARIVARHLSRPGREFSVDEIVESVDLLDRNILRAHRLVQDFKSVSVGQTVDDRASNDLYAVVSEVVNLFEIEAKRAKLAIELRDGLGEGDRTWLGYRAYLTQVVLNLLTNVERYAYADGKGGRVTIDVSTEGEEPDAPFAIEVRDFGVGMPAEALAKVFEPFYTTGRGGTGLGMAVVYNLVTSGLGGSIQIDSEPEKGTAVGSPSPGSCRSAPPSTPIPRRRPE